MVSLNGHPMQVNPGCLLVQSLAVIARSCAKWMSHWFAFLACLLVLTMPGLAIPADKTLPECNLNVPFMKDGLPQETVCAVDRNRDGSRRFGAGGEEDRGDFGPLLRTDERVGVEAASNVELFEFGSAWHET